LGDIISESDLSFARPATEFKSSDVPFVCGQKVIKPIPQGHTILRSSVEEI